jgi:hypothetical protein
MAIENLDAIGASLGLESGKFAEMISSEDSHKIDLDNFVISNKTDYESRLSNIKRENQQAGLEIAIKNARNELGLEFEGKKDLKPLLEAYKNHIEKEAKIEPNQKYDTLKSDFEKIQGIASEWETKFNDLQGTYKKREQQRTIDNTLLSSIPDNTTIPKDDVLAILKAKVDFNIGDDGLEIIKDGVVQKNESTLNLLSPNEFMKDFITPYLKKPEGGAGGKDSGSGGRETSFDLFNKQMEDKGISQGSEAYNVEMSKAIQSGTLKF